MGVTSGAGTAYPSGVPEFTSGFSGVRVTRSLVLYVCFVDRCLSFKFVLFLLAIALSVLLRYTDSDCPFGIFKLYLTHFIDSKHNFKAFILNGIWFHIVTNASGVIQLRSTVQYRSNKVWYSIRLRDCCLTPHEHFCILFRWGDNDIRFLLDCWILIVLAHWHNIPQVDMSPHSDTLS